ncbi:MAG: hypothetical protein QOI63_1403 [Thermoplasmata archaeon]|nr:hypothetical protein [Thermoplasmata archaeon]
MGYSLVAAAAVVFLATFVAGFALTNVATRSAQEVDRAWHDAQGRGLRAVRTQAEVASVAAANGTLTVTVRNTGATAVDAGLVDLLVDGVPAEPARSVEGTSTHVWAPGDQLALTVAAGLPGAVSVVGPDGTLAAWRA